MSELLTEQSFKIIALAGTARSFFMEALESAKQGDIRKAGLLIENGNQTILEAHKFQTALLQEEARGKQNKISMIVVHAQDHLMMTMLLKDMIDFIIELYSRTK